MVHCGVCVDPLVVIDTSIDEGCGEADLLLLSIDLLLHLKAILFSPGEHSSRLRIWTPTRALLAILCHERYDRACCYKSILPVSKLVNLTAVARPHNALSLLSSQHRPATCQ